MGNCATAIVLEYQKNYSALDMKMMEECKALYDFSVIYIYACELEYGFKVKRINKTTAKGTKVTYSKIESKEELDDYLKKIEDMRNKYKAAFGDRVNDILDYIKPILEKESRNI